MGAIQDRPPPIDTGVPVTALARVRHRELALVPWQGSK